MASSSSSSTSSGWLYDVFLSFRGADTRTNFTDHLHDALIRAGIRTFRDDNELESGKEIGPDLLKAIEKSRFSIVVFSKTYASSAWCLDELAHIMNRSKTGGQTVLPVFYDVDPADVRYQKKSYAKAFGRHEDRFKKQKDTLSHNNSSALEAKLPRWRAALTEAANLSGYHVEKSPESGIINKIVERISNGLPGKLKVAIKPVGTDSRSHAVKLLLVDARIVGIYGIGGIGKTTIAKEVYNSIFSEFESTSFLFNVREEFRLKRSVDLQHQLLFDILKRKDETISNSDRGRKVIEERLRNRKILVVLDDVDDEEQITKLLGNPFDWLSQKSRIIITTRIKDLIPSKEYLQYQVEGLNQLESLWLFSTNAFGKWLPEKKYLELLESVVDDLRPSRVHWEYQFESLWLYIINAFNDQGHPTKDYKEYSKRAVDYCGGIPLALEVLGSTLSHEKSVHGWKRKFEILEKIPHNRIQKILKISYDSLDPREQKIFLDIACFFIGEDKKYVTCILDGCGFFADDGINTLIKRCLLKIHNKLEMHDLIRDMGRHIVVEESSDCGERSRVWRHEEAFALLQHKTGTKAIEGLILNLTQPEMELSTKAFRKMKRLRLLQLNSENLTGSYGHISKQLRWLCWSKFHLEVIPPDLYLGNVVTLDMRYSSLKQVWEEGKLLEKLKILNLSHSHELKETPNFIWLPNLEILGLEDCPILVEVHESIEHLTKLVTLNLKDCRNLVNLPRSICALRSLENLIVSGCSKLDKLPEKLGNMKSLVVFAADGTAISRVPETFRDLESLTSLDLSFCQLEPSLNLNGFLSTSLRKLELSYCNLSDGMIPDYLQNFSLLEHLNLCGNDFSRLPRSISLLPELRYLWLSECLCLESMPKLPSSLLEFWAWDCVNLKRINLTNICGNLFVYGCRNLVEIKGVFKVEPAGISQIVCDKRFDLSMDDVSANSSMRSSMLMMNSLTETSRISFFEYVSDKGVDNLFVRGSEIPSNYQHRSEGNSITFKVHQRPDFETIEFTICVVYSWSEFFELSDRYNIIRSIEIQIFNETKKFGRIYSPTVFFSNEAREDIKWLTFWNFNTAMTNGDRTDKNKFEGGDMVRVEIIEKSHCILVKKCGVAHTYISQSTRPLSVIRENKSAQYIPESLSWLKTAVHGNKPNPIPVGQRQMIQTGEKKKAVLKLEIHDDKGKRKAMKAVSHIPGVDSIAIDMKDKKLTVIGDIDVVTITKELRKLCFTEIVTVEAAKGEEAGRN